MSLSKTPNNLANGANNPNQSAGSYYNYRTIQGINKSVHVGLDF